MTRVPPAIVDRPESARQQNAGSGCALTLDDDALMLFEDGLRENLPGVDDIVRRAAERKHKKRAIASVAIVALAGVLFWLDPVYKSEQVATAIGERSTWTLEDGSEVSLNTASVLRVEYHLRSRHLYLTQGEALFKVEHSRWRSFWVYANQTRVEDIGTVFNVRNTERGAQVTVLEGSVQVSTENEPAAVRLLQTGQSVETDGNHVNETAQIDANAIAAWHDGKLHFDNTPLAAVVAELQRYRQAPVRLSSALADLRITGQFDIDRIDQLLSMLPTLASVNVRREADGSVAIVPRNEEKRAGGAS